MKIIDARKPDANLLEEITLRPAIDNATTLEVASSILRNIKLRGLEAVLEFAVRYDNFKRDTIRVSEEEIADAETLLSEKEKAAIQAAYNNIYGFHRLQQPYDISNETLTGVVCERRWLPVENVGLYIPGGTAVLPSTVLMLGIPALIAGCKRVVLATPASETIHPAVLYAASLCRINEIYAVGGAQAIGMMAYGVEGVPRVDKIFGPGNQFVTAAKMVVASQGTGCSIDMPAGPSEVLVIADSSADPAFVAVDLLSQAEHGTDSQAILVTDSEELIESVSREIEKLKETLPRKALIEKSLEWSRAILVRDIESAFEISNLYAPEHLIVNLKDPGLWKERITNAGSVFLGPWSPESAGDYASGTNHSLPTSGYARSTGGVTVESFMKTVTFQQLTREGLETLAETVTTLARSEGLDAHALAVTRRLEK